ncbi:hypothetical protein T07_2793 [Trichinella nelsoni]|uniref:Uncharacterized protein n=1 Tax=Trichinella nelsoni TaxID=6336 RepID=A0A0V0RTH4_9BILA|nr:hypothetical protein T07_2793 [Trichinella nelsoni]
MLDQNSLKVVKIFVCLQYCKAATVRLVYQKMYANFYSSAISRLTCLLLQWLLPTVRVRWRTPWDDGRTRKPLKAALIFLYYNIISLN